MSPLEVGGLLAILVILSCLVAYTWQWVEDKRDARKRQKLKYDQTDVLEALLLATDAVHEARMFIEGKQLRVVQNFYGPRNTKCALDWALKYGKAHA